MKKLTSWVLGLSALAVACSTAGAVTFSTGDYTLRVNRISDGQTSFNVRLYDVVGGTPLLPRAHSGFVGAFVAYETANPGDQWYSFCTDLTALLQTGSFLYQEIPVTPTQPVASDGYATPWSAGGMQAAAAIYKAHAGGMDLRVNDDRKAYGAALQLAIWESLYDTGNGYGAASGRLQATIVSGSAVDNYFNAFMASATTGDFDGVIWLKPDPRDNVQGNLRLVSVPEPAMLFSSLLALGLGWVGRRRMV